MGISFLWLREAGAGVRWTPLRKAQKHRPRRQPRPASREGDGGRHSQNAGAPTVKSKHEKTDRSGETQGGRWFFCSHFLYLTFL